MKARLLVILLLLLVLFVRLRLDHRESGHGAVITGPFPEIFGQWHGEDVAIDADIRKRLDPDAMILRRYSTGSRTVELYGVFYNSQTTDKTMHSPLNCYPGSGWEITAKESKLFSGLKYPSETISATRLRIHKGLDRRYLYYWYYSGGHAASNQYLNKWFTLVSALTDRRTDGGLMMIIMPASTDRTVRLAEADFIPQVIDFLSQQSISRSSSGNKRR